MTWPFPGSGSTRHWIFIVLLIVVPVILVLLLLLAFRRWCRLNSLGAAVGGTPRSVWSGVTRLHPVTPYSNRHDRTVLDENFCQKLARLATDNLFSWSDHPTLVTEAFENGWSRFGFTTFVSSLTKSGPMILGIHGDGSGIENKVEIGWEICDGSDEYLQKVRLNPGLKRNMASLGRNSPIGPGNAVSAIRAALPLPGPQLGGSGFPKEAYFEVTILPGHENDEKPEDDTMKLIGLKEEFPGPTTHIPTWKGENEEILLSVGFSGGGYLPLKFPGTYPGSIGFNSTGSVYLDGKKLVLESKKNGWGEIGAEEMVVGCGYNPNKKCVYFTVDSNLAYIIHCTSEPFKCPLYPILASGNLEVSMLINLGQSPFKYGPPNAQRTPNPCFIHAASAAFTTKYEDSRELFSMGRIDSQWQLQSICNVVNTNNNVDSEEEFFEIPLGSTRK